MNYQENNIVRQRDSSPAGSASARVRLLLTVILASFAVVALRLAQVQVVQYQKYRQLAQKQYQATVPLPAARGTLYDRNGSIIASNSVFVSYAADPTVAAEDARLIANKFSKVFGKPYADYLHKLRSESRFVWLERVVDVGNTKKINPKEFPGLVVRSEPKRLYHDQVAGQLIGSTDLDNKGIAGIEAEFDNELRGADGYVVFQRDGLGHARASVDYPRVEPINGSDIFLTIDMQMQSIAEQELKKGIEQCNAEAGIAIILRPKTGEILALAQCPNVDPNSFRSSSPQAQRLRAVTDMFEPGSIFKIVTASSALESGLVAPETPFYAENGTYVVPVVNGKTRTITDTHKEGWISFREAIEFSSNIVMAKISNIIGSERLYTMARDYGFGIATNLELPGEVSGVLKKPSDWSATTLNTIAFGYEVGVTPIQIAAAYGAVANGGILMKPYLFMKEQDQSGQVVRAGHPQQIRRVISAASARTMTDFFEGVVERGTGKSAALPGMKIAGKTGTSRKYTEGHYEKSSYTASFVGFFPSDDPQIVCLVMMDDPRGGSYTGGLTSAPVFRAIAQRLIATSDIFAPPARSDEASAKNASLTDSEAGPLAARIGKDATDTAAPGVVPDVKGCSLRRAVNLLSMGKFLPVVNGSGTVVSQSPAAGSIARPGMKVVLTCQARSAGLQVN